MADISRSSGSRSSLRASDADRERVAAVLRRHHLDGRLDTDELQDRLGACYAGKTHADLAALVADLPGEPPPAPRRSAGWGAPWRGPAVPPAAVLVVAAAVATAAAIAHGRPGPLPLLLVLLFLRLGRAPRRSPTAWTARG